MLKLRTPEKIQTIRTLLICLGLLLITVTALDGILQNEFVEYDDQIYITDNSYVKNGLTIDSAVWAFTTIHTGNWHPLTWLSHTLDCQIYGLNPAGHHLTNLIFHTVCVLLLFLALQDLTGAAWRSAFAAALFAVHPMRVESVAWAAERKDVLSGFFFMLILLSYARYVRRASVMNYALVVIFLCLGLMSKSMLVTVPFVLLLLDYWPLRRFGGMYLNTQTVNTNNPCRSKTAGQLILEKIPLFIIVAVISTVTFFAQRHAGAMAPAKSLGIYYRAVNAIISYVSYIEKTFWPANMAIVYPLVLKNLTVTGVLFCLAILAGISVAIISAGRTRPYFVTGWLWYLGTLVPVIGIVQVGVQSMADRYSYLPSIGVYIIIAWGLDEISKKWPRRKILLSAGAAIILGICVLITSIQVGFWKNSLVLFAHALDVTKDNHIMHLNYGTALEKTGEYDEAVEHYKTALKIDSSGISVCLNIAAILLKQDKADQAIKFYKELLPAGGALAGDAYCGLGMAYLKQGNAVLAEENLKSSISLKPKSSLAANTLASALKEQGRLAEAVSEWEKALKLEPDYVDALNKLAWTLATTDDPNLLKPAQAVEYALKACNLTENKNPKSLDILAAAYAAAGRFDYAVRTAQKAVDIAAVSGRTDLAEDIKKHLQAYQASKPWKEPE